MRRLIISTLWSSLLVLAWLLVHLATDRCWFYVNGIHYVSTIATVLFTWLLVFFVLTKWHRVVLVVITVLIVGLSPIDWNTGSAAASGAASTLRKTADKLEQYRTHSPTETYPSTIAFDIAGPTQRFYYFEYVPISSGNSSTINAFLLKARPFRYDCGLTYSFILGPNRKIHFTRENRDATEGDPILN
jgi:hypothetical protein